MDAKSVDVAGGQNAAFAQKPLPLYATPMHRLAALGLYWIFPGFFLWSLGRAVLGLPSFGAVGPVLAVIALLSCAAILPWARAIQRVPFIAVAVALIFYAVVWTAIHHGMNADPLAVRKSLEAVTIWTAMLFIGVFFDWRKSGAMIWLLWVMAGLTFYFSSGLQLRLANFTESATSYQGMGRSMLVVAIIAVCSIRDQGRRLLLAGISALLLFMTMARSELAAFVLTVVAIEGIKAWTTTRVWIWGGLVAVSVAILLASSEQVSQAVLQSRGIELLDLASSKSWNDRNALSGRALEDILGSPLLGRFGADVSSEGTGAYAHNVLSVWVSYGVIGFALYFGLTLWAAINSWSMLLTQNVLYWRLAAYFNVAALILILGAKSYGDLVPPIGWGIYAAALMRSRSSDVSRPVH